MWAESRNRSSDTRTVRVATEIRSVIQSMAHGRGVPVGALNYGPRHFRAVA